MVKKIGNGEDNVIFGSQGDDQIYGKDGNDILLGGAGQDLLDGGTGADTMQGGRDNDTYIVDNKNDKVVEYAGNGGGYYDNEGANDKVLASIDYTLPANVEELHLIGFGDLDGTGNELSNIIYGNDGNNTLKGLGGNDFLYGGAGDDILVGGSTSGANGYDYLYGGNGDDVYVLDGGEFIFEYAGGGNDTIVTASNYGLLTNFENLVLTGTGDFSGYGNAVANIIVGNSGNNNIDGKGGADTMRGGDGDDRYTVNQSNDVIVEYDDEGFDTVESEATYTLSANVEKLLLMGSANTDGGGNDGDNVIWGNVGDNSLYGNGGEDILYGGFGGTDTLYGGEGNDSYRIDDATDVVVEFAGGGDHDAIYVNNLASYTLAENSNVEELHLEIFGTSISATGNSADNFVDGNNIDNVLNGAGGVDQLTGHAGDDTFVFRPGETHGDVVIDFQGNGAAAGDVLRFEGYGTLAQGTTFHQLDATHWMITSWDGAISETIALANGAGVGAFDMQFV